MGIQNWHRATTDDVIREIENAAKAGRGITVSPLWLTRCMRQWMMSGTFGRKAKMAQRYERRLRSIEDAIVKAKG